MKPLEFLYKVKSVLKQIWLLFIISLVAVGWLGHACTWPSEKEQLVNDIDLEEIFLDDVVEMQVADHEIFPEGFGYVHEFIPDIIYDIRYFGHNNFLGVPVDGYFSPVAILTQEALEALRRVAFDMREKGYGLIIYDGYRPQIAVDHFVRWASDSNDTITKSNYYPHLRKSSLLDLGYIASQSGHTRGSAIDLILYDLQTNQPIDMGSEFDIFGPISAHGTSLISPQQAANRRLLRHAMVRNGFIVYEGEWWHYSLANEPFPDTYFDFYVE